LIITVDNRKNMIRYNLNKETTYMTKTNNRKNKQWLRSRDQRKHEKIFNVQMTQLPNGQFQILGGGAEVAIRRNRDHVEWYPVNVRDLAREMRMNGVISF
jgi:hypothetical protein